ncbi:MAG: type II secretion system F family protein [Candidatus Omnitrophica bacterium]|nr:type II secretion system F family protein [Candidatus Omnitrophota bacterium]
MATFKYTVKDENSKTISGKFSADNREAVIEELRKRKYIIISLAETKEEGPKRAPFQKDKVNPDEIVLFARQLATMIDAGIPILQALDALEQQTTNAFFKAVLGTMKTDIEHGSSLSAAFAKHPKVFNVLFINMVKVGETGGVLSQVLDRVSSYMEKTLKLQRKVKAALTYPIVVVSMAIIITVGLLVKVVPTFAKIYDSLNQKLPAMTLLLITISNLLKQQLPLILVILIVTAVFLSRWHKSEKGARVIDGAILKMPIFGDLLRKVAISRFSRTLATLIQSGVPILEALNVVQKTIGNKILEDVIEDVKVNVKEGESIAAPLERSKVFPAMVTRMISVGEKSGKMETMLLKVSEFYDDQVDAAVDGLTSIIEPLIIGVLGIIIGFIVIALFMPILAITQLIK